jgi:hypothetical protein
MARGFAVGTFAAFSVGDAVAALAGPAAGLLGEEAVKNFHRRFPTVSESSVYGPPKRSRRCLTIA